jgi:hypothetical protein
MSDHHHIDQERIFFLEPQEVSLTDLDGAGFILDIGGGGEGVIGRLKGAQVVAIDANRRELAEAPPGPLRIVMDARELQFLDGTFAAATSFFTLMFVRPADHAQVFEEVLGAAARRGLYDLGRGLATARAPDQRRHCTLAPGATPPRGRLYRIRHAVAGPGAGPGVLCRAGGR